MTNLEWIKRMDEAEMAWLLLAFNPSWTDDTLKEMDLRRGKGGVSNSDAVELWLNSEADNG